MSPKNVLDLVLLDESKQVTDDLIRSLHARKNTLAKSKSGPSDQDHFQTFMNSLIK